MNRLPLLSIALLFGLGNTAPADEKPKKGDLAKLQGTWTGKTGLDGCLQTTFIFNGDSCLFDNVTKSGEKIGGTGKVALDELAKPHKTITQTIISRYGGVGRGPDHVFGIYEFIDANTVRICNGFDQRPTDFSGRDSQDFMVFTLKRETKEEEEEANAGKGAKEFGGAKAPPFVVEGFYRVKWGYADEFLRLYKKNHLPVLKRLRDEGRLLRIEVEKPRYHAAEGSRWDYRVRLSFRDADAAHDPSYQEEVKKQLFSDQDAYRTEESRRFEILESHWDVVVDVVDLDTK
jgi:hypothetical protein